MTPWAGMRRATRFHLARTNTQQMAFVLEHTPEFTSNRGIVPPIPKASSYTSASTFGFKRGQIFSTDEPTVIQQRQQDQQIRSQMREFTITPLVGLPALLDVHFIVTHPFLPQGKMGR